MDILKVRFSKVYFTLVFIENTMMMRDKVSAFRGGIGEMLLRANCVRDRDCPECDFLEECPVQRMMYAKSKIAPEFVTEGESMGYVFECENKQEEYEEGESLQLSLTLFGNNIVYFQQYLNALAALGQQGIGKNKSRFVISEVLNSRREAILEDGNIYMKNYKIESLEEYVEYRMRKGAAAASYRLDFLSPTAIKFRGEVIKEFDLDAIFRAALRRIYMLDCFEGILFDESLNYMELPYRIANQEVYEEQVARYSNHKQEKMQLKGISGQVLLEETEHEKNKEMFWKIMYAGEIIHIGKNTRFGFGKYRVTEL